MNEQMVMLDGPGSNIPKLSPVCAFCKHLRIREGRTCAAFPEPDSIPMAIWLGENDHQAPVPGDHGIQFEPAVSDHVPSRPAKEAPTR